MNIDFEKLRPEDIKIEKVLFDTELDGLKVIKTVCKTELPLENSQDFCIRVWVVTKIYSDVRFSRSGGFSNRAFFGTTYEQANKEYLEWLKKVTQTSHKTATNEMKLRCVMEALSL